MLNQSHTPFATHQYTANTHTQLQFWTIKNIHHHKYLDNHKCLTSQISQILWNWYHTHHQAILDNHKYLTKNFFAQQQYQS